MGQRRFIVAGSLIDGSGKDLRRKVFLAVKDGIIIAIGPAADLPRNAGAAIDDFSHCIILPALVDCSVAMLSSPSLDKTMRLAFAEADYAKKAAILERHSQYCLAHGVQGVANSDDLTGLSGAYQDGIIAIRTSARLSVGSQGVVDQLAGGDFLRIPYSSNIDDNEVREPRLNHEDLCRLLRRRGGKKAVVVANGRQKVEEALEAGADAIEQGYGMGEENLQKMADNDVLWIPSVVRAKNALNGAGTGGDVCCRFSLRYVAPGKAIPGAEAFWQKTLAGQLKQLRFAREVGVKMAVGTGAGSLGLLHGESMAEEMKLFIKAGFTIEDTIRSASENGARFFGMEKLGALTVGRQATFVIARGTIKQLPRKLSYLEGIYVDGAPSEIYHK